MEKKFLQILILKVSTVDIEISEIVFEEFEPGQDFTKPPTAGSNLNHRFNPSSILNIESCYLNIFHV